MPVRAIQKDGLAIMTSYSFAFCFLFRRLFVLFFLRGVGRSVRR